MKSFDRINRRAHLYFGLFLIPWLCMYGASAFMVNHRGWFLSDPSPAWQTLFERDYQRPVTEGADLREVAQSILSDCGLEGAFWVNRNQDEIHIDRFRFRDDTRLTYSIRDHRLKAEWRPMRWNRVLLRLHFRGGFLQPTFGDDLWAVLVDVACIGILIWVASGLVMWWRLARLRFWGSVALAGGTLSFVLLVWQL